MASTAGPFKKQLPHEPVKELPFDSARKMMSVCVRRKDGKYLLFTKGAPDLLLDRCTHYLSKNGVSLLTPAIKSQISQQNDALARRALRVLGFAYREADSAGDIREERLIFTGMAGMIDPPRKEAFDAVIKCREAGIRPVMITGDHAVTCLLYTSDAADE